MNKSNTLTTFDFAAANNLPIVLDSKSCQLRPLSAPTLSPTPAGLSRDLAASKRPESLDHCRKDDDPLAVLVAKLPNKILPSTPNQASPTLGWSSLLFNQPSSPATDHAGNQRPFRDSSDAKELSTSWLTTCSQSTLNWLPILFVNIPSPKEKEEEEDAVGKTDCNPTLTIEIPDSRRQEITDISGPQTHHQFSLSNVEKETTPSYCPTDSNEPSSNTPLNRSVRFSDPTPLGLQMDQAQQALQSFSMDNSLYRSVDPFPSPTPGKRFLGRGSIDSNYQSPRKASLPDWVVNEYLSSTNTDKKLEPIGILKPGQRSSKGKQGPEERGPTKTDAARHHHHHHPNMKFTLNSYKNYPFSSAPPSIASVRRVPSPGKVFYPLLDHAQVRKFNLNNHDSLSLSPNHSLLSSSRLQHLDPHSLGKHSSLKHKLRSFFSFRKIRSRK
ncbi:hypothetical protein PGT21_013127 [Puccinia graminis f. sp. tritici]|uniref:Uncharacterized protein n=2 Tax=Puccinia graminis f. sp. tritici TaxID=56615 RepID=E3KHW5_PUCGT|nr:uncharacterized protein PGTG_09603 [Puccinia graminis f. sp. tritici CRL 75-36-700-3]EFP83890.1 hypothetical protein PGTG_09603 [Puccinia graminis f. sp. tritici CRL 75-36-700-3]KAA1064738.1 hypothetical protein PGT21_013127 [Puccinia graminis f. sp. tritici]